jgi:hypothetical protein
MDPIAAARYGMMVASQRFESAAGRVAQSGASADDGVGAVVDMVEAKHQYVAQVRTLGVADEMWRALMDVQADTTRPRA